MIHREDNIHVGIEKLAGYTYRLWRGNPKQGRKQLEKLYTPPSPEESTLSSLRRTLTDFGIPKTDPEVIKATKQLSELKDLRRSKINKKAINQDITEGQEGLMEGSSRHMPDSDYAKLPRWRRGELRHGDTVSSRLKSRPISVREDLSSHYHLSGILDSPSRIAKARHYWGNKMKKDRWLTHQRPLRRKQVRLFMSATDTPMTPQKRETTKKVLEKLLEREMSRINKTGR